MSDISLSGRAPGFHPNVFALGAIALWASLATLGVSLAHMPPFLLTGLSLMIGSVPAWWRWREWRVSAKVLALGICALFGYHFLLFVALRHAPPVEANLVNYLWPLLIVVMAPLWLPKVRLRAVHVAAGLMGFAGAGIAILGGHGVGGFAWGYLPALGAAFIWAGYSLSTRRLAERGEAFPTSAIGLFGLVSGLLSLGCHLLLEPRVAVSGRDLALVVAMGLGPLGAAFFLWDRALKAGDPRTIGVLSYLTPLGSTALLALVTGRQLTPQLGLAALMVVGAALLAVKAR